MQIDFHGFLLDVRGAVLIWLALVAVGAAPFLAIAVSAGRRWRRLRPRPERRVRPRREAAAARQAELRRYAEEVAVAASRAAVTAERRRAEWAAVTRTQQAAWRAYDEAAEAARRTIQAEAFGIPDTPSTVDEVSARRRYLERAAAVAYRRGDLSAEQFGDVLAGRDGWDPRRHPFEQETRLRVARRDRLRRACDTLSEVERSAWRAAEVAVAAKRSLDAEALSAAFRVRQAGDRTRPARRPVRSVRPMPSWNADTAPIPRIAVLS
ncbi:hypothetical protein [Phytohabitans suffuscus]|uniref:AP2/ERF domain-containing protein n=1 Tax=Phytohabitans suffuscus TaxID=624315 RepID=A0A6F8YE45_9ACTN|nr:hypothetical protein [Phytohabitans suffuscus]BCB84248.1 hypothetical protein Psuf_015610 [Phytohabitans suffuscus]